MGPPVQLRMQCIRVVCLPADRGVPRPFKMARSFFSSIPAPGHMRRPSCGWCAGHAHVPPSWQPPRMGVRGMLKLSCQYSLHLMMHECCSAAHWLRCATKLRSREAFPALDNSSRVVSDADTGPMEDDLHKTRESLSRRRTRRMLLRV